MNTGRNAQKFTYVPGTQSAANPTARVATYAASTRLLVDYRSSNQGELVRAGRSSAEVGGRVWYKPYYVTFAIGDRIAIEGVAFDIVYVQAVGNPHARHYLDVKAVQ